MATDELVKARLEEVDKSVFHDGIPFVGAVRLSDRLFPVDGDSFEERIVQAASHDLFEACALYLSMECKIEEQTLSNLYEMVDMCVAKEDPYRSALDMLFREVEKGEVYNSEQKEFELVDVPCPDHPAVVLYEKFRHKVDLRYRELATRRVRSFCETATVETFDGFDLYAYK